MKELQESLGTKQKELLQLIQNGELLKIEKSFDWCFIYQSIKTFQCLCLVNFQNNINTWEDLQKVVKNTENKKEIFYTTYSEAVNWLHNDFVLCNNIVNVDGSIWDNMRFSTYDEENDSYTEIYQWFITDCNEGDVEYLEKHFGLLFTYSNKLDCYILCVDHLGTSWDYVACEVLTHGEELSPHVKSYEELTGQKF